MYNPDMYQNYNDFQKRDSEECLEKFKDKMKFKKHARVIDLGSGDGSVTEMVLKNFVPDFDEVIGVDVSDKMVEFANRKYRDDKTKFLLMDIGGDVPKELKGKFDHVYSSYALQYIIDKEKVFRNIYDLLVDGGTFTLVFLGQHPVYDIIFEMSKRDKWRDSFNNRDCLVVPYQYMSEKETENAVRAIVEKSGFHDVDIQCNKVSYVYENLDHFKRTLESINNCHIPPERIKECIDDGMEVAFVIKAVEKLNADSEEIVVCYNKIEIFGLKKGDDKK